MFTRTRYLVVCASVLMATAASSLATENVKLTFSKPTNSTDADVTVKIDPGKDVTVTIPADSSATQKRDLIKDALIAGGYDVTTESEGGGALPGNQLRILYLRNGTKVTFVPGKTGELKDDVVATAAIQGEINFIGLFDPIAGDGELAVFTAGVTTDAGELTAQVNSEELGFITEGPAITDFLYQILEPQAADFGVEIINAGDRLDVLFDPAFVTNGGGVSFGTTSLSEGCEGSLLGAGVGCLGDLDGDGIVGLSDLGELLAAYGATEDDDAYLQRADLDGDGVIGLADLGIILDQYGWVCD